MPSDGRVSPAEAHAKMTGEGFTYVDVRTPGEFEAGRPQGSVNVPLDERFIASMRERFASDAKIVVGCGSGPRSARAVKALAAAGFTNVLEMPAGWDGTRGTFGEIVEPGWRRVGLPTDQ